MGLLYNDNVIFYLPFTSGLHEYMAGKLWTDVSGRANPTASGLIGSGFCVQQGYSENYIETQTLSDYPTSSGTTSLTMAVWTSGIHASAETNIAGGYGSVANYFTDGLKIYTDSTDHVKLGYYARTTSLDSFSIVGPVGTNVAWHLIVARVLFDGSVASGDISINGSGWQSLGALSEANYPTLNTAYLRYYQNNRKNGVWQVPVDEFVLWKNAPQFTNEELQNLYDLATVYNSQMSDYELQYPLSESIDLFISGPIPSVSSGSCDLFIKSSVLLDAHPLYPDNIVFYHPFTSGGIEYTKSASWSGYLDSISYTEEGLIGSGVIAAPLWNDGTLLFERGNLYAGVSGTTSMTMMVWTSGSFNNYTLYGAGWGNYNNFYNGLRCYVDASNNLRLQYWVNGSGPTLFTTSGPYADTSGWTLLIGRISFDGTDISGDLSINGSGWKNVGTLSESTYPTGTDSHLRMYHYHKYSTQQYPADEVVLWRNIPKFTNDQLSELYELGDSRKQLSQYPSNEINLYIGGIPANDTEETTLFVCGKECSSGLCDLSINGIRSIGSHLLYPNDVVFYHPFTSGGLEYTQNVWWFGYNTQMIPDGFIGSGVKPTSLSPYLVRDRGSLYPDCSGDTSYTAAIWSSGSNSFVKQYDIGWGDSIVDTYNSILLHVNSTTNRSTVGYKVGDRNSVIFSPSGDIVSQSGWVLIVGRVYFNGVVASGDVSVNGGDWVSLPVKSETRTPSGISSSVRFEPNNFTVGPMDYFPCDEVILWHNIPKLSTDQLKTFYQMGLSQFSMDQYPSNTKDLYIGGCITSSGSIDLFIDVPEQSSGTIPAYVSGYLPDVRFIGQHLPYPDNVVYYHPFTSGNLEQTKLVEWDTLGAIYVSGLIGSGITGDGFYPDVGASFYHEVNPLYDSSSGTISITSMYWTQGAVNGCIFGWSNSGVIDEGIYPSWVYSNVEMSYYLGSNPYSLPEFLTPNFVGGWHLIISRLVFDGTTASGDISLNGSGWQSMGSLPETRYPSGIASHAFFRYSNFVSSPGYKTDEVVLWKNIPKFTYDELQKIYQCGLSLIPMDFYPANTIDLHLGGHEKQSGFIDTIIGGFESVSDSIDLFVSSADVSSGNIDVTENGHLLSSGSIDLHTMGPEICSESVDLFLKAQIITESVDLYVYGIFGYSQPLFLKTYDGDENSSLDLMVYGSPSGQTLGFTLKSLPLSVYNDSAPSTMDQSWHLFINVESGIITQSGGITCPLFMQTLSWPSGYIGLFISGPDINSSGICDLYTIGDGELSYDTSGSWPLYLDVHTGEVAYIDMCITGFEWPSGVTNLYVFGISGISYDNVEFMVHGHTTKNSKINLFTNGTNTISTSNIDLFVYGFTAYGTLSSGYITFYEHGY